jgi:hypothetical protein
LVWKKKDNILKFISGKITLGVKGCEEMLITLKKFDDRPKILWRFLINEPEEEFECRMRNTPLEFFICNQINSCKFNCIQKLEQFNRPDYVREQQLKMLTKIEDISHNNGNNGKKK